VKNGGATQGAACPSNFVLLWVFLRKFYHALHHRHVHVSSCHLMSHDLCVLLYLETWLCHFALCLCLQSLCLVLSCAAACFILSHDVTRFMCAAVFGNVAVSLCFVLMSTVTCPADKRADKRADTLHWIKGLIPCTAALTSWW